jgi:alanyl-tRNA synthetase
VGSVHLWTKNFGEVDPKLAASELDNAIASDPNMVGLVATVSDGKIALVAKVGPDAQKAGGHAGNLVREISKFVGGGGGGRPDFATAGGKNLDELDNALSQAQQVLSRMLG